MNSSRSRPWRSSGRLWTQTGAGHHHLRHQPMILVGQWGSEPSFVLKHIPPRLPAVRWSGCRTWGKQRDPRAAILIRYYYTSRAGLAPLSWCKCTEIRHVENPASYITKRFIPTNLFISTWKHATSSYNYEWDKTHLIMQPCMGKNQPPHATMHGKKFILLFYLYSTNILQLYLIKYTKLYTFFYFGSHVIKYHLNILQTIPATTCGLSSSFNRFQQH